MQRFMKAIAVIMLMTAMLAVGCTKPDEPNNGGNGGNNGGETPKSFIVNISANPTNGGAVTGGGTFQDGETCTVSATTNTDYIFANWTENEDVVSTEANYTFTVDGNRTLVANFTYLPAGAINGKFTINDNGDQVYFSQGNLQYQASTNTWQFAANQYDYIGDDNSNISSSYSGWIDLFGWGTSGWDSGNTYYHPWDSDNSNGILYGPSGFYDLTDTYANADWGVYNAISNGGNQAGKWRTLTCRGEWYYVFYTRAASTVNEVDDARFAKAKVADVHGVILFPDNYTHPSGVVQPIGINDVVGTAGWNRNDYSASDFALMQDAGAVFLPAAGQRIGTSVSGVGSWGDYWSTSWCDNYGALHVDFYDGTVSVNDYTYIDRYCGRSVRLVCSAQ